MGHQETNLHACLRVICFLIIVCGIEGARAVPTLRAHALLSRDEAPIELPDCTIEGDEGLYGIGVRAGIYLQVFASMFTLSFKPDQGPAFLYAAAALQAALFVALVYASAHQAIYASEALIAILLLIVMILFEMLVFSSIFIHFLSGQFRLANAERVEKSSDASALESTLLATRSGSDASSTSTKRRVRGANQTQEISDDPTNEADEIDDTRSLSTESSSGQSLTRQKTRTALVASPAKLNINDALYNSDPLLIDDENLRMLVRVVDNYAGNNAWASAILIFLLILGCYGYMLWFWWVGMDGMKASPCGSHGFFIFALFEINHWIKWVVRVVLALAAMVVLGMLFQCVAALVGFAACLIFQFGGTEKIRRSESAQKMQDFFNRVAALNLPSTTEYLLLVLVFKSFLVHSPERIFMRWIRRMRNKDGNATPEQQEHSATRDSSRHRHRMAMNRHSEDKAKLTTEIVVNSAVIKCSDFFKIHSGPFFCIKIPNKIVSMFLNPQPSPLPSQKDDEKNPSGEARKFIMPYADNFDTITINLMILFSHLLYFTLVGILLAAGIWSVELTISKNHIAGVNNLPSAAQLIPFIIGLGSFTQSGLSALGALVAWVWGITKLRRKSETWFEALVERFFYETDEDSGGVDVQYLRHFPLMLVIWMLFPSMRKGQSIYDFTTEFSEEMNERGGLFALDLLD